MTDAELIEHIRQSFARAARPEAFANRNHCDECREHDDLMRSRTPTTLQLNDVENPGWNPVNFLLPDAFRYFLPGLIRVALDPAGEGVLGDLATFHLAPGRGKPGAWQEARHGSLSQTETAAVVTFLQHVMDTRENLLAEPSTRNEVEQVLKYWKERRKSHE